MLEYLDLSECSLQLYLDFSTCVLQLSLGLFVRGSLALFARLSVVIMLKFLQAFLQAFPP